MQPFVDVAGGKTPAGVSTDEETAGDDVVAGTDATLANSATETKADSDGTQKGKPKPATTEQLGFEFDDC